LVFRGSPLLKNCFCFSFLEAAIVIAAICRALIKFVLLVQAFNVFFPYVSHFFRWCVGVFWGWFSPIVGHNVVPIGQKTYKKARNPCQNSHERANYDADRQHD